MTGTDDDRLVISQLRFAGRSDAKSASPAAAPVATTAANATNVSSEDVARLTAEVAKQGEVVRELKVCRISVQIVSINQPLSFNPATSLILVRFYPPTTAT